MHRSRRCESVVGYDNYANTATGASIVLVSMGCFVVTLVIKAARSSALFALNNTAPAGKDSSP